MALEIVGELFGGIFRILFRIVAEVLLETLIKGAGYLICRPFSKNVDPDGLLVVSVGILFWVLVFVLANQGYDYIQVEKCLDAGGLYNYESNNCDLDASVGV